MAASTSKKKVKSSFTNTSGQKVTNYSDGSKKVSGPVTNTAKVGDTVNGKKVGAVVGGKAYASAKDAPGYYDTATGKNVKTSSGTDIYGNKINSNALSQSSPYISAGQPKVTDPGDLVGAGNAGLVTGMSDMTLTDELLFEKINNGTLTPSDTLKYIQDNTPKPPSQEKAYFKSDEYDTVQREQKAVNDYTAQINAIQKRAMAQQLSLEGQGRGQTESFVGGEQARINREAAIAALPIQAQLAAAQGNLEFAQKQLDTVFTLRMQDAQNKYKYETDKLNSIVSFLDKTETRQYNEKIKLADREYQKTQDNITYLRQLSAQAREYGRTDLIGQLGALDPASPTFESDVARISKGIVKPVSATAPDLHNFGTSDNPDWRQYNPSTGTYDEVQGLDIGTGANLSKVQKTKISDSIAANQELNKVLTEYKSLIDDVGFEGSTFGGVNLGKYKALKARMTTILKSAETLGTLDEGVRQLVNDLVGEIPEKGVSGQNVFGFQSRAISSQLATTQRLVQESIKTKQERLNGGGQLRFEALPEEDTREIFSSFGMEMSTASGTFNPDDYLNP